MIDLDGMKTLNDTRGTAGGDDALVAMAGAVLVAEVRGTDLVGRLGGDEFAVLLPETSTGDVEPALERFRAACAASVSRDDGQPRRLGVERHGGRGRGHPARCCSMCVRRGQAGRPQPQRGVGAVARDLLPIGPSHQRSPAAGFGSATTGVSAPLCTSNTKAPTSRSSGRSGHRPDPLQVLARQRRLIGCRQNSYPPRRRRWRRSPGPGDRRWSSPLPRTWCAGRRRPG